MRILGTDAQYRAFMEGLIRARKKVGLTQVELAARLGTTQQFVSKYEIGERRLDVVEFMVLMQVLDVDPDEVLREFKSGK